MEEDVGFCGWGAEIIAEIAESAIYSLQAPIKRVAAPFTPVPFSTTLEKQFVPSTEKICSAVKSVIAS